MTDHRDVPAVRKHLRVGHRSERGAVNAVRSILEGHGMVVDEVDGRGDYGRDLNADIVLENEIVGGIIGVQVKGGKSFYRKGRWVVPAKPADWEYWRSSTVPIIGIVHDPDSGVLRWRNLTEAARSHVLVSDNSFHVTARSDEMAEVVVTDVLDDDTFGAFIRQVVAYLAATADSAFLLLLDRRDEVRRRGVFNCWTLGRRDPRPLILLRRLLPTLEGRSLMDGISVLAHATPHPDIFWTPRNWISPPVAGEVTATLRWSPDELVELVHKVEIMNDDGVDWQRGGIGQSLWSIMAVDPDLRPKLRQAIGRAVEDGRLAAGVRLLVCLQAIADDARETVEAVLRENPALLDHEYMLAIRETVQHEGSISLF